MNSPFLIVQDFLSPQTCEKILKDIHIAEPDKDLNGDPIKLERFNLEWDQPLAERFRELVPQIEEKFNCVYRGLEKPVFQFYPENAKVPAEGPGCENAKYIRKKWVMTKDVDLVAFVWLKDYNDSVPLDPRHEIYGGKLEFPAYNFSLMPQRGTLVLFPAGPHFISVISPVLLGDLYQIKLPICVETKDNNRWFYQPANYPGSWQDWLAEYF